MKTATKGNRYQKLLADIRDAGEWDTCPRLLDRRIGVRQARMLMYLANVSQSNANPDGWLRLSHAFVRDGLGIDRDSQDRLLTDLELNGFVEVSFRDGRRYVRVNDDRIREELHL